MSGFRRSGLEAGWIGLKVERRDRPRGPKGSNKRLGAEHKGLRVRGLAVGSSQLPWAHIQLAASLGPVKGLVGLDSGGVCSRGARSSFDPPTLKPGTVAPSAARRRGGGGEGRPAGSIGRPPTARRNAGPRAGGTGVAAPSVGVRPKPRRPMPRGRTPPVQCETAVRGPAPSRRFRIFSLRPSGV